MKIFHNMIVREMKIWSLWLKNFNIKLALQLQVQFKELRGKTYCKLGLESLTARCWFRELIYSYKIVKCLPPNIWFHPFKQQQRSYNTTMQSNLAITQYFTRHEQLKHFFFHIVPRGGIQLVIILEVKHLFLILRGSSWSYSKSKRIFHLVFMNQ